ncbi:neprilysin-21 [Scaptodrosophila lebanonensis]|uniref:Neprilysin-21 n=1 Tax=Drosophila lebanonensis TaxID=7225 RepID=A0A6J2T5U9_DROLE|nr:neprilysin-21 [Scaptodrosophila lebanonensis]
MICGKLQVLLLVCVPLVCAVDISANIENDVLHFSYELERLLDSQKQPCQDFYGYVCSRTANLSESLRDQRLQHEEQRFERFIAAANEDKLQDMELKLKNFYKSCKISRDSSALMNSYLYQTSGGWPALETTVARQRTNQTWLMLLAHFHETGVGRFFGTRISMRSNKRIVELQTDATRRHTLSRFEQLVGEVMRSYAVHKNRMPVVALEVLNLERSRRDILKSNVSDDQVEFTYESFKRSALGNVSRSMNWDTYFKKLLGKPLKPSDSIVFKELPKLLAILTLLENTSPSRLLNWLWIDYLIDIADLDCHQLTKNQLNDIYVHVVQYASSDRATMAAMYAAIGKANKEQLSNSSWIDEMSQQSSQQFLGRVMHLTLNGDDQLDASYSPLSIDKFNFYRNMEQLHRFQANQQRHQRTQPPSPVAQDVKEYEQVFRTVNMLLDTQTLTTPLNYLLVGEHFARSLLAAGSSSRTPGAWRSMDSERAFSKFQRCTGRGLSAEARSKINANDVLLSLLAQKQTLHCYNEWFSQEASAPLQTRLNEVLAVGRLRLTLKRLYFIGSTLVSCGQGALQQEQKRHLLDVVLRNSPEFSEAFSCRAGEPLYVQQHRCLS